MDASETIVNEIEKALKPGLNVHIHKQNHLGDQLDDLSNISTDPNLTHIDIRNPADYPVVRGRPHGSGR